MKEDITKRRQIPQQIVVRSPNERLTFRLHRRSLLAGLILVLVIITTSLAALSLGKYDVSLVDIVAALTGDSTDAVNMVVVQWRLPRALLAVLFGAALGLSGAIFQSLTRNALGSPDVIGFNMGSYSGVLVVMLLGGSGFLVVAAGALTGGLVTALLVYVLAFKRGVQGFRLIIIGIAVSAMLASFNTWVMVKVDVDFAMQAAVWGAGTLNGITWVQVWPAVGLMTFFMVVLALFAPRIRQLELGDDTAALQGLAVEPAKITMIVLGIGFTALVTAAAGPIAFIALAAPQVARRIIKFGASVDLVTSALVGAALLSLADLLAQHAFAGVSLPVGAVTVCIGGCYLIWLLAHESKDKSA